jgi:hypothetical protein
VLLHYKVKRASSKLFTYLLVLTLFNAPGFIFYTWLLLL